MPRNPSIKVCATMPQEELRARLHTIAQGGRRMSDIIDELLLLAEVRNVEEMEMRALDMASIVGRAQERLVHIIEKHRAEIILPDVWPAVLGHLGNNAYAVVLSQVLGHEPDWSAANAAVLGAMALTVCSFIASIIILIVLGGDGSQKDQGAAKAV